MALDPLEWLKQRSGGTATIPKPVARPASTNAYDIVKGIIARRTAPTDDFASFGKKDALFSREVKPGEEQRTLQSRLPAKVEGLGTVTDKFGTAHKNVRRVTDPTGRQYLLSGEGKPVVTERATTSEQVKRIRGGSYQDFGTEVDHLIPKSLGGTDTDTNLRARKSEQSKMQKANAWMKGLFGVKAKRPDTGKLPPELRQEGKMVVELEALDQYRSGKITLPQARAAVVHFDNADVVNDILGKKMVKTSLFEKANEFARTLKAKRDSLAPAVDKINRMGRTDSLVDPELAARLKETGQEDRLKKLEEEEILAQVVRYIPGTAYDLFGKPIIRSAVTLGVTAASNVKASLGGEEVDEIEVPEFMKRIIGDDPLKPVTKLIDEATLKVKEWGEEGDSPFRKAAAAQPRSLAFIGVIGMIGLDLVPFGGGVKPAAKAVIKANTPDAAARLMRSMGVSDDIGKRLVDDLVKAKTETQATKVLTRAAEMQRSQPYETALREMVESRTGKALTPTQADQLQKEVPKILKKATKTERDQAAAKAILSVERGVPFVPDDEAKALAKEMTSARQTDTAVQGGTRMTVGDEAIAARKAELAAEARQYKSADEFVQAQTPKRLHGAAKPIKQVEGAEDFYSPSNIYGQGFYTTDSFDIATGYARRKGATTPTLYDVVPKKGVRLFDLESELSKFPDVRKKLVGDKDPFTAEVFKENKTLREAMDEFREMSSAGEMSTDTVQEKFLSIRNILEEKGYSGLRHTGGRLTGRDSHKVEIYWNPKDVEIKELPFTSKKDLENAFNQAKHPSADIVARETPPGSADGAIQMQDPTRKAPGLPSGFDGDIGPPIDPARMAKLDHVRTLGKEGRNVNEIARTVQMPSTTVRQTLQEAGILPTDEVRAALKKDRMESVGEYLKDRPVGKYITDPQNVIPTKVGPIDPNLATPRLSVFEEVTLMRRDVETLQKSAKAMKNVDQTVRGRMTHLENSLKTREHDYLNSLDDTKSGVAEKAEEEMRRKFTYETVMTEEFVDTEMEAAFHRFRKASARRPWMLDPGTDDALLKQKLADRIGSVDDIFFENSQQMTNDEILDVFKARVERIKSTPKPDLKFLRSFDASERRMAEAEGRLDDAFEKLKETAEDREALQSAIKAIEDKSEIVEETRKAVAESMRKYRDIGNVSRQLKDIWRNTKRVFGKDYDSVKKILLDPLDDAKGAMTDEAIKLTDELDEEIVKKLGIKANSKESAAVQLFGEGLMTESEMVVRFGQKKSDDLKAAADWFRQHYDDFLDEVNDVRRQLYPNNPDKIIPKRKDYFRHFQEMEGGAFDQLLNIFETPAAIDPRLAGISMDTKPKAKWLSFAQRREGTKTKFDAVGGYLNYVRSMVHAKHIDPAMVRIRDFRRDLAEATVDTKNLNTYLSHLEDVANQLAGKTHLADRWIADMLPGGRRAMHLVAWVNSRAKANLILGKLSNLVVQSANLPIVAVSGGKHAPAALLDSFIQLWQKDITPISQSRFIRERYDLQKAYDRFDSNWLKLPLTEKRINVPGKKETKKAAIWITDISDKLVTRLSWNIEYRKAIAGGSTDPIRVADEATRALVAGRGVGEVPVLQTSRLFQLAAPFTLEMTNAWWVKGANISKREYGQIIATILSFNLYNRASEKLIGRPVLFDPVGAIQEGVELWDDEMDNFERSKVVAGRLGGEVLSNIPLGSTAAGIAGVGIQVAGQLPLIGEHVPVTKEEAVAYLGDTDPRRFGSGLLALDSLKDWKNNLVLPFGGQQLKLTREGIASALEGAARGKSGSKQFDIDLTPENYARAVLFGKYAVSNVEEWRDNINRTRYLDARGSIDSRNLSSQARDLYKNLQKATTPQERLELLKPVAEAENIDLLKKVAEIKQEEKLGITQSDRELKSLNTAGRARFLLKKLDDLEPGDERREYLVELRKKKILTDALVVEMAKMKAEAKAKSAAGR